MASFHLEGIPSAVGRENNNASTQQQEEENMEASQDLQQEQPAKPQDTSADTAVDEAGPKTLSQKWTALINMVHKPMLWCLQHVTYIAARFPFLTCFAVIATSFVVLGLGYLDGFYLELNEARLWTPSDSNSMINTQWAAWRGYEGTGRFLTLLFHAQGDDVISKPQIQRMFDAYETVTNIPGYDASCAESWYRDLTGKPICEIQGAIRFWNASSEIFQREVQTDEEAAVQMSPLEYPDGYPVEEQNIFGQFERSENKFISMGDGELVGVLTTAKSYYLYIYLSYSYRSEAVEQAAIDALLALDDEWRRQDGDNPVLNVEVKAGSSFGDEFLRGIIEDMPLVPFVALMMICFTCFIFWKRHRVYSRTMLGLSAVAAVGLSVMTAYGILFFRGVPFTPMLPMLPFILFGIGLDDAFVIMGSYHRTNPKLDTIERIRIVVDDIGISITLTTLTSTIAFSLGTMSSIPAVRWLCQYAFPSIMLVYFYQLTFFVGCIVIDERRVRNRRMDCCFCVKVPLEGGDEEIVAFEQDGEGNENGDDVDAESKKTGNDVAAGGVTKNEQQEASNEDPQVVAQQDDDSPISAEGSNMSSVDAFMENYGRMLLRPKVKMGVSIFFVLLTAALAASASQITQEFSFQDVLPRGSYLAQFLDAQSDYANLNLMQPGIYFRDVDQSDPEIRVQMKEFINVTRNLEGVSGGPDFCWLFELEEFVAKTPFVQNLTFNDQLAFFLGIPINAQVYLPDIRLDQDYNIRHSRCLINFYNVDFEDVTQQIEMLDSVKRIAAEAPINQGREREAFFTSHADYNTWEFYSAAVEELIFTAFLGIFSVTAVAFILIPHWSAAPIVFPTMCILYVDLIGVLNLGGIPINAVSYVTLVVSIGLMVDFIMHVLLRYYESLGTREEKTLEMLRTMGSSVTIGGISTFLATLPLAFSSSDIFRTIVIAFLGLVTLGVGHGLIILPVFLATFGTEEQVTTKIHHGSGARPLLATATVDVDSSYDDPATPRGGVAVASKGSTERTTGDTMNGEAALVGDGDILSVDGTVTSTLTSKIRRSARKQDPQERRKFADPPAGVAVFVPASEYGKESLEI